MQTPIPFDPLEKEGKKFRVYNQRLFLSYHHTNGVWDKNTLAEHLRTVTKRFDAEIEIANEIHEKEGSHTYVGINFKSSYQSTRKGIFDYGNIHPIITKILNAKEWASALVLLHNIDEEVIINSNVKMCDDIWECNTMADSLLTGHDPLRTKIVFEAKQRQKKQIKRCNFKWYKIIDEIIATGDDRYIYWICDEIGRSGKSKFCRWAISDPETGIHCIKICGRKTDFSYNIVQAIKDGWKGKAFILDMSRSNKETDVIYGCLEDIKDGWGNTSKYDARNFWLDEEPVTIVFANRYPDFDKLSLDRWKCFKMVEDENGEKNLQPLTLEEARIEKRRMEREQRKRERKEAERVKEEEDDDSY